MLWFVFPRMPWTRTASCCSPACACWVFFTPSSSCLRRKGRPCWRSLLTSKPSPSVGNPSQRKRHWKLSCDRSPDTVDCYFKCTNECGCVWPRGKSLWFVKVKWLRQTYNTAQCPSTGYAYRSLMQTYWYFCHSLCMSWYSVWLFLVQRENAHVFNAIFT